MKNEINSDDDLHLGKTLKITDVVILIRPIFNDSNKYYPLVFVEECLHKIFQKYFIVCINNR